MEWRRAARWKRRKRRERNISHHDAISVASVFFRIEEFSEAGIFLQEGEILVVAGVIALGAAQIDRDFQIRERRVGFASGTIESDEREYRVIGFGRALARF